MKWKSLLVISILTTLSLMFLGGCGLLVPSVRDEAPAPRLDIAKPATAAATDASAELVSPQSQTADTAEQMRQNITDLKQREAAFNQQLTRLMDENRISSLPAASTTPPAAKQLSGRQLVSCNFDSAELLDVVRLFMQEFIKQDFLIYPGVEGQVTMEINSELTAAEIRQLLEGILQINKMTLFFQDDRWHIMPLDAAPAVLSAENLILSHPEGTQRGQSIRAYQLRYVAASELVKVLTPYLTKGAQLYAHEASGMVLLCDYPHVQAKVARLVELFDVGPFAGMHMKMFWLHHVLADELVKELDALAKSVALAAGSGASPNNSLSFVAMPRLNLLLALSRDATSLEFADLWVRELDREMPQVLQQSQEEGVFIYSVRNGMAEDIVTVLQGLFAGSGTATAQTARKDENQNSTARRTPLGSGLEKTVTPQSAAPGAVSGTLSGPVTFVVDAITNAILVRASGADYRKILPVMERLDVYPKQALIEVTIAEVQLDDSNKLGIEWQYLANNVGGSAGASSNLSVESGLGIISGSGDSLISSGLSYLLVNTDRFTAALKAYSGENRVNVLSAPHILASDNQEARIDIGDEVPIVTSEYRTTETSSTATTVDKTIQYRDVGVILAVTPHISENGTVRMEISQEVSELSQKTVQGVDSPVFSKRSAATQLAVNDGQTIVIAGLMQQKASNSYSGVPLLARLPLLRYLFGYMGQEFSNTELMIFITPHVILNEQDTDFLSRSFLDRLEKVRAAMNH